jgi:hypothetical protein
MTLSRAGAPRMALHSRGLYRDVVFDLRSERYDTALVAAVL